jgi:hypothetical protein
MSFCLIPALQDAQIIGIYITNPYINRFHFIATPAIQIVRAVQQTWFQAHLQQLTSIIVSRVDGYALLT